MKTRLASNSLRSAYLCHRNALVSTIFSLAHSEPSETRCINQLQYNTCFLSFQLILSIQQLESVQLCPQQNFHSFTQSANFSSISRKKGYTALTEKPSSKGNCQEPQIEGLQASFLIRIQNNTQTTGFLYLKESPSVTVSLNSPLLNAILCSQSHYSQSIITNLSRSLSFYSNYHFLYEQQMSLIIHNRGDIKIVG